MYVKRREREKAARDDGARGRGGGTAETGMCGRERGENTEGREYDGDRL